METLKPVLTKRELTSYSLTRALTQAGNRHHPEKCFEAEVDQQIRRDNPRASVLNGCLVPNEVFGEIVRRELAQRDALGVSVAGSGGYLTGDGSMGLREFLFPVSVAFSAGAKMLPITGPFSSVTLPGEASSDEGEWISEFSGPQGDHETQISGVVHTARRVYSKRTITKQLLAQVTNFETFGARMVRAAIAAAIDRAVIAGDGGVQPKGILNTDGCPTHPIGTDGGAPTNAAFNTLEGLVFGANAGTGEMFYAISPKLRTKTKGVVVTGGSKTILETVMGADFLNGHRSMCSKFVPENIAKGSGTDLSAAVFGDWTTITVSQWAPIALLYDPYTQAASGKMEIHADALLDVGFDRPELLAKVKDFSTV